MKPAITSAHLKSSWRLLIFKEHGPMLSLSVSPLRVKLLLGGVGVGGCGLILSLYFNYQLDRQLHATQQTLRTSQTVLFDYQSQLDGIYEGIYPHLHRTAAISAGAPAQPRAQPDASAETNQEDNDPNDAELETLAAISGEPDRTSVRPAEP